MGAAIATTVKRAEALGVLGTIRTPSDPRSPRPPGLSPLVPKRPVRASAHLIDSLVIEGLFGEERYATNHATSSDSMNLPITLFGGAQDSPRRFVRCAWRVAAQS